jgi:hypothetical protein
MPELPSRLKCLSQLSDLPWLTKPRTQKRMTKSLHFSVSDQADQSRRIVWMASILRGVSFRFTSILSLPDRRNG